MIVQDIKEIMQKIEKLGYKVELRPPQYGLGAIKSKIIVNDKIYFVSLPLENVLRAPFEYTKSVIEYEMKQLNSQKGDM